MKTDLSLRDRFDKAVLEFLNQRVSEFEKIPGERKAELQSVADFVFRKLNADHFADLIFICTHNSRRSHLSQVWAHFAAIYFGFSKVRCYSGGTEATAFNPRAVKSLQSVGLQITPDDPNSANPLYTVRGGSELPVTTCFSKRFDAPTNPQNGYCAVMTCSHADENCPAAFGCELRAPIRYEDPKVADDTPNESSKYLERSEQICREMLYLMSRVNRD